MNTMECVCERCGSRFDKSTGRFNESKKNGWKLFCSKECFIGSQKKRRKLSCANCGKDTERMEGEIRRSKTKNFFCTQRCAAIYNNKKYKKKKKYGIDYFHNCLSCKKKLEKYQSKYCNNRCRDDYHLVLFLKKWFKGEDSGTRGSNKELRSSYIEKYLRSKYKDKCHLCGWGEVN